MPRKAAAPKVKKAPAKMQRSASRESVSSSASSADSRPRRGGLKRMEDVPEPAVMTPTPTNEPTPPPTEAITIADAAPAPLPPLECIPLAAVEAVDVDRASEAAFGLLKEPPAPAVDIPRVTKEGEPAPPLPTELMQLLSC